MIYDESGSDTLFVLFGDNHIMIFYLADLHKIDLKFKFIAED